MATTSLVWNLIVRDDASGGFSRAAKAADAAAASMSKATAAFMKTGASLSKVGSKLTKTVTLPLVAVGAVAVKSAVDFNSSMLKIQTQAGGSARDVQTLSRQVLALGQHSQQGPQALADALYHLKSVGMDNADAMRALKQGTDLANVSGANLEDTVNALAGAWRTGIRGATSFHQAVATVNAIVGAGNMKVTDLTNALGTGILPTAKTFGLTFKDVGSALALFTDEGMSADSAATRLRMSFSLLGAPSKAAEAQLKSIGLSGISLANDMRQPNGLITAIGDLKSHLDQSGKSAAQQSQILSRAFGGGRSSSAILSLINNFSVLQQKQAQVTAGMDKFNAAVKAQAQSPQAQFKELLSSLETTSILIGNQLLPVVLRLAHGLEDMFTWVQNLSPGVRTVATDLGMVAAAAGPLIWTLGKFARLWGWTEIAAVGLVRVVAGMRRMTLSADAMQSSTYLFGRNLRNTFSGIVTAIKNPSQAIAAMTQRTNRLGAALGGVGIGVGVGMLTRHASTATKALSSLGAAAAGAATGFAMGGPMGAAIGGLGAGLASLATQFIGNGDAAAAAAKKQAAFRQQVVNLTQAMQQDNNTVGRNTQAYIQNALMHSGAAAAAQKLGVNLHDLQMAATGNVAAQDRINAAHQAWLAVATRETAATQKVINSGGVLTAGQKRQQDALAATYGLWGKVTGAIGGTNTQINDANKKLVMYAELGGKSAAANRDLNSSTGVTTDALKQQTLALHTAYQAIESYASAQLANAQSQDQFLEAVQSVNTQLKGNNDSLGTNTAKGLANRDAFLNAVSAAISYKDAQVKAGDSVRSATQRLADNIAILKQNAVAHGADAKQVDNLLKKMGLIPHIIRSEITLANAGHIESDLVNIGQKINQIVGNHIVTLTVVDPTSGVMHGNTAAGRKASGGGVPDGLSWVGEGGPGARPELLAKHGANVQVLSHPRAVAFAKSAGIKIPGFASGTSNERRIWDYLRRAGFTALEDAGIMGNLQRESGFSPLANNGSHFGIAQWDGSRWAGVQAMARRMGTSEWTLGPQLAYLVKELRGPYRWVLNRMSRGHSARHDAGIFNHGFEVSGDYGGTRAGYAASILSQYGGTGAGPTGHHLTPRQRHHRHMRAMHHTLGQNAASFRSTQHPNRIIHAAGAYWVNGQSYGSKRVAEQALRQQQIQNRMQALNTLRSGLFSWTGAMGSVHSERQAFRSLLPSLRTLGMGDKELRMLEAHNKRLDTLIHRRMDILSKYDHWRAKYRADKAARHQLAQSVSGAVSGFFDLTGAGAGAHGRVTARGMLAQETQALHTIHLWANGIDTLRKRGLSNVLLRRFATAGPSTWPQVKALLDASPKLFKEILHESAAIDRVGRREGWQVGQDIYKHRIHHDHKREQYFEKRLHEIERHQIEIERRMVGLMEHIAHGQLDVKLIGDGRGHARWVKSGDNKNKGRK